MASPTFSEVIYNIQNLLKSGRLSDDNDFNNRQVAFIVNYYRAKLIKERLSRGDKLDPSLIQNLAKVELKEADKDECCDIENCVLRSVEPLPQLISHDGQYKITYVGNMGGSVPYQSTSYQNAYWTQYRTYTGAMPKWYIADSYLYIVNPPTSRLKYITVKGVFANPHEVTIFKTCTCGEEKSDCYKGFDFPYPITMADIDLIYKLMVQTELRLLLGNTQDTTNDSIDRQELMQTYGPKES